MAVLAAFVGGWGHAEPLLPIARLAGDRGHEVTFAGQAAVVPRLSALGFGTVVVGPDTLSTTRRPLVPVDRAMEQAVARDHFVGEFGTARATHLGRVIGERRSQVVVCDEMDAGAIIAAESAGIACVTVSVIAAGRLASDRVVGPAWSQLRAAHGLGVDPDGTRFAGTIRITPAPASFRDPDVATPFALHHVRPPILDEVATVGRGSSRPLVYATLGTVFDVESGDLFGRLVEALRLLDVDSLLTIGSRISPSELPPTPEHVRVEAFVAQRDVLGDCSAVVCHGGTGTVIAALSLGIPVVVLPMGADQPDNADRCRDLGAGLVLDAVSSDPTQIAGALRTVLDDDSFSSAAQRLADEAAAQPHLSTVRPLLELL